MTSSTIRRPADPDRAAAAGRLVSTVYVSRATVPFSDEDLEALLATSRANNDGDDVTGLLLFRDGQFMQALEGPEDAVRSRIAVIAADTRHADIRTLVDERVSAREFPKWTMGFRPLTDAVLRDIPGYEDYFAPRSGSDSSWGTPTRARWLLDWFRLHTV